MTTIKVLKHINFYIYRKEAIHANQYFIFLLSIIDLLAKCQMTRQMKAIMNLSKNMDRDMNGVMKGIPMNGDTGTTFLHNQNLLEDKGS